MTYQALARKWRPQDFASLIGQEPVVTALRNALVEGRIAQAYLFAGIRGVGKTTAARVLAKALNCEKGPAADPCNQCVACREITVGADLDVLEVDAATYSKVEQVRDLTESLRYGPARDRYKVVVLDEVHRLSRQAFDALLKIVEEPPPHLVFVFATTEAEAVPATILSRCQEFRFRRVPVETLAAHLETLCRAESITASPSAVRLLARAGEGSVRDAVALLDQLATYGAGTIADEDAGRLLGGFDLDLFHRLLAAIAKGDGEGVASLAAGIEEEGWDPRQLYSRFLGYCRDALHLSLGGREAAAARLDLPADEVARLQGVAKDAGYENLLRLLHQLIGAEQLVRRSEVPGLAFEVALLRAAELPKLTRVEELLRGGAMPSGNGPAPTAPEGGVTRRASAAGPPPSRATSSNGPAAAAPAPRLNAAAASPSASIAAPVAAAIAVVPEDSSEPTAAVLHAVARRRQVLAAHLGEAQALHVEGNELHIFRRPGDSSLEAALQRPGNRTVLDEALAEVCGAGARWRILDGDAGVAPAAVETPPPALAAAAADPKVQAVLDIFGGTIAAVERATLEE
ncbi:MAG TPA: DNA polymerase III subunit gamma/tau [Thermoanaerobaculia bacterium]|jgi:DNA polymerase-3 subunit gamma/tau|nr:DNA polymerase III subunit gamma/tau [Thermoanaerobaculia bacterium]